MRKQDFDDGWGHEHKSCPAIRILLKQESDIIGAKKATDCCEPKRRLESAKARQDQIDGRVEKCDKVGIDIEGRALAAVQKQQQQPSLSKPKTTFSMMLTEKPVARPLSMPNATTNTNKDDDEPKLAFSINHPSLSVLAVNQLETGAVVADSNEKRLHRQLAEFELDPSTTPATGGFASGYHAHQLSQHATIRPTRKRYFILFMFFVLQVVKSFQWICLASITNVVAKFYRVDNLAINWTTILFMVTFLVLAMPVSWIMDSIGLRRSVLIGAVGVTLGVFIKCFSCHRDGGFAISMWGHLIVGLCEPFFFSSYSQLASIWFPDNQVALATAISLIGEQTGLALGFIIPPLVIGTDPNDFEAIQRGLFGLFTMIALISILNTISIVLFFDDEPRLAPGIARYKQKQDETIRRQSLELELEKKRRRRSSTISRRMSQSVGEQVKLSARFFQNKHFMLLLAGFGICQGICYSLHTLLNQMIVQPVSLIDLHTTVSMMDQGGAGQAPNNSTEPTPSTASATSLIGVADQFDQLPTATTSWPGDEATILVGNAGLILVVSGLIGSAGCGYLLDKYHQHKSTTLLIYLLNLVAMAALTGSLLLENSLILYLATIPLGFAQLGYVTCAFDYSVELTYPKPELVSSTLLNMSAQIFGIPISLVGSMIVDNLGSLALGAFFCLLLLVGCVITCLQGGELRRQSAVQQRQDANQHHAQVPHISPSSKTTNTANHERAPSA